MRILIYTGKGGVGKTSVAAATGIKLAKKGVKTLIVSTDLAHSLSDSFGIELSHQPTTILNNLEGMELNPQHQLENRWDKIYHYMVDLLKIMGVKDIFAEEVTLIPGVEELFSLLEVQQQYQAGDYQTVIMDFPPTASAIRLLSFFDVVGWYMERFFKFERKSMKVLRTFTNSIMEVPLPEDDVYTAFEDIYNKMAEAKQILANPDITSVRLVMNPEEMVINESQRAYTYLNLYGFHVDSVIVNKLFPELTNEEFYQKIINKQKENLGKIKKIFSAQRVFTLPLINEELKGMSNLTKIANMIYQEENPQDTFYRITPMEVEKEGTGYHFKTYLPFINKEKFSLHQKGGVLILTVGSYKQKVYLPQILSNKSINKARYKEGFLHLYFNRQ